MKLKRRADFELEWIQQAFPLSFFIINAMRLFQNIQSNRLLYAKGVLFLVLAVIAAAMLISRAPRLDIAALLLICIWASCRSYYFAFYVIEHYVDGKYRFAGLFDFCKYIAGGQGELANEVGCNNNDVVTNNTQGEAHE